MRLPAVVAATLAGISVIAGSFGCTREREPDREPPPAVSPTPAPARPAPAVAARPRPAALTRVTIKALGMYCEETCPIKVRTALAEIPAVYELGFDLSNESVFVSYDAALGPAKEVTRPMLVAIKSVGFDPWLAREAWPDDASTQVLTR